MKVGICIVFYNDTQHLQRLAQALKNSEYKDVCVYFTDNSPSLNHVSLFKELIPEAVYVPSHINTGFAGGNNLLAAYAEKNGCDFVWILNPDMQPSPTCLNLLLDCLNQQPDTEAAGPVLLYGDVNNADTIQFAGAAVDFRSQKKTAKFTDVAVSKLPKEDSREVDLINGGSILIRAGRLNKEPLFAEEYFMYNDELDLMRRIKNDGKKVRIVFTAFCRHHHDWSKNNAENFHLMYYYMMRNKVLYWKKYGEHAQVIKSFFAYLIKFPVILRFGLKTSGFKLLYYYYLGLFHGYLGKKGKSQLFG